MCLGSIESINAVLPLFFVDFNFRSSFYLFLLRDFTESHAQVIAKIIGVLPKPTMESVPLVLDFPRFPVLCHNVQYSIRWYYL